MPALALHGEETLSDAAAKADVIVAGRVSQIRPTPGVAIDTVFRVDHTLKGELRSTVVISQAGRLQQTQDSSGTEIVEDTNGPVLLPGDLAVLFLQKMEPAGESLGEYYIQSFSGWYKVVDGRMRPSALNTFGASIEGKTEAEFIEMTSAAVNEIVAVAP